MAEILRLIRVVDRESGRLAGEIPLPPVDLAPLRTLFDQAPDNPMYDCFEIQETHRAYFEILVGRSLDLQRYEYFLECEAVSPSY